MPSGALTPGDFDCCGWQEVTADCEERACWKYSGGFVTKVWEAGASDDMTGREVFGLPRAVTTPSCCTPTPGAVVQRVISVLFVTREARVPSRETVCL